jgi:hypothetical protein
VVGEDREACLWRGTPYELNGVNTHFAFESNRDENNPILFPVLHKDFYYMRNAWGIENQNNIELPKDVWTFKECKTTP